MSYPLAIPGGRKDPIPQAIIAPKTDTYSVRHYYGSTGRRDFDRLWITAPSRHAQEVTTGGQVNNWPGDQVDIDLDAGEELRISLNGGGAGGGAPYAGPNSFYQNTNNQARVHFDPSYPTAAHRWAYYIEWEDLRLDLTPGENFYNDSRTLIWGPILTGWQVGRLGMG